MSSPAIPAEALSVEAERLGRLLALTPVPAGPLPGLLAPLLAAGAASLGYAIEPAGRAFGVLATGQGPAFAACLEGIVGELLDPKAAGSMHALASVCPGGTLRLEVVLGEPSWLRAGVRGIDAGSAREILRLEGFATQLDRALKSEGGSELLGLDLHSDGRSPWAVAAVHRLAPAPTAPAQASATRLIGTRFLGAPLPDELRRGGGLEGRALFDWLAENGGLRAGMGERLGVVQAELGAEQPDELRWIPGQEERSRVLLYRSVGR
mgnify:CR=1 FL=1